MRALGDISREEFLRDNEGIQNEAQRLRQKLDDLESVQRAPAVPALDLENPSDPLTSRRLDPSEIALARYRREHAQAEPELADPAVLDRYLAQPQELFTFSITEREAGAYCQSIGMRFFKKKWQDKTVIVSI